MLILKFTFQCLLILKFVYLELWNYQAALLCVSQTLFILADLPPTYPHPSNILYILFYYLSTKLEKPYLSHTKQQPYFKFYFISILINYFVFRIRYIKFILQMKRKFGTIFKAPCTTNVIVTLRV